MAHYDLPTQGVRTPKNDSIDWPTCNSPELYFGFITRGVEELHWFLSSIHHRYISSSSKLDDRQNHWVSVENNERILTKQKVIAFCECVFTHRRSLPHLIKALSHSRAMVWRSPGNEGYMQIITVFLGFYLYSGFVPRGIYGTTICPRVCRELLQMYCGKQI